MGIRSGVGAAIVSSGSVIYLVAGLVGFVVGLLIVAEATGGNFFAFVLAFLFFPATIFAAPWYALIVWSNPIAVAISYGGFVLAVILVLVGRAIAGESFD